jgi:dipicolinate synthase subunit A
MSLVRGVQVAVLGGDRREAEAARYLAAQGAGVRVWGQPADRFTGEVRVVARAEDALRGAAVVVGPVRGTDGQGRIWSEGGPLQLEELAWGALAPGTLFLIGAADPALRERVASRGACLEEYRERDDFAIWNSVPTAEGAVFMALREMDVTLHGSSCLVLGLGRTGTTLARLLAAMGARVSVAARRSAQLARAEEMGCRAVPLAALEEAVGCADVVFNTIPAPVLHAGILRRAQPGCVIIDLASAPGGTDFACAAACGLRATLAPGLPGIKAPVTAGRILGRVVEEIWRESRGKPGEAADGG